MGNFGLTYETPAQSLSHEEVMEATEQDKPKFLNLVLGIIEER